MNSPTADSARLGSFLPDMEWRGLVHQVTADELRQKLASESMTAYIGFDPTAASLHVGSLLQILALVRLQRAGHRPIAIVGGGTGMIGDPSGKSSERTLLDRKTLEFNVAGIRAQLERFLDFSGPRGALLVNNLDWLGRINLIDFLRDIGKHFSVNAMINRDSVKLRFEGRDQGMSYTEFSYALLQAVDFLELYDRYGCNLQVGGSDQWGNIVDGCDLIRRLRGGAAWGLTQPLVTKSDGSKFGKSESGNVWIDADLTSPYSFYQFWINAEDRDAGRYLRFFTFLDQARIRELDEETARDPAARTAQKVLAEEVTRMVHGPAGLEEARRATEALFGGDLRALSALELKRALAGAPTIQLPRARLGTPEAALPAVVALAGLAPSRSQARGIIQGGAIWLSGRKVDQVDYVLAESDVMAGGLIVMRRGGKTWSVIELVD